MKCEIHTLNSLKSYKYVVILSWYHGKILLSQHKRRETWETQGGHIEPGETPLDAAQRELIEESGAEEFTIEAAFDYWAGADKSNTNGNGMVFVAHIERLGALARESEMARTMCFDALPKNLTYPDITPKLFAYHQRDMA